MNQFVPKDNKDGLIKGASNTHTSKATQAVEDTMNKLDQVFKLRDKRYQSLDNVMEELRQKNVSLYQANSDLANELRDEKTKSVKMSDKFNADIRKLMLDFESQKQTLVLTLSAKKRENESLKTRVDEILQKNVELTDKCNGLQVNLDSSIASQKEMQVMVKSLEASVEERIGRVSSEAERTIHQIRAKSDGEKRRLMAQIRETESRVDEIKLDAERVVAENRAKLDHERRRNDELSREKDCLRQEVERLNTIVISVQATVEQLLSEEMRLAGVYESAKDEILEISNEYNPVESEAQKYFQESFDASNDDVGGLGLGYIDLTSSLISSAQADVVKQER